MREYIAAKSINQTVLQHEVANNKKKFRKLNLEIAQLKNELGNLLYENKDLKQKIKESELKISENNVSECDTENLKSILKPEEIRKERNFEIKENLENPNLQKVKFTKETKEPQVTVRGRRGGRILESKPIYIPSVPKKLE